MLIGEMKRFDFLSACIVFLAVALNAALWYEIVFAGTSGKPQIQFLDVGQGDSELVQFPNGVKILTDAGPDSKASLRMGEILPSWDRYIDIGIISHPQLDHFGGFRDLIARYQFGAFVINGRMDAGAAREWTALLDAIRAKHIPLVTLTGGDAIRYETDSISILSPDTGFLAGKDMNNTGLVELIMTPSFRALFAADTDTKVEQYLASHFDIHADILKVSHHGSKYSSGDAFLRAVNPKVAVVEVGERNRYGHPTPATLARIASDTFAKLFRTDLNGTVRVETTGNMLAVYTAK